MREAYLERLTKEMRARSYINLDRFPNSDLYIPKNGEIKEPLKPVVELSADAQAEYGGWFNYLTHWINQIGVHGPIDLRLTAYGDDDHHVSEDVGILLGKTLRSAIGDKKGIRRVGSSSWPFGGNRVDLTIDLSDRPSCDIVKGSKYGMIQDPKLWQMLYHFWDSLTINAGIDFYAELKAERKKKNDHHLAELLFKTFGKALYDATRYTGAETIPSSKGVL